MAHVSITTPRSATFIFSLSALTNHSVLGEKLAQVSVITSGLNLLPLSSTTVCIVYLHIQPASMIFMCLTFNLLRSRNDVPGAFPSKLDCHLPQSFVLAAG
ncbi:hypothetical protein K438DRAFT_1852485 [Mycena galopus ATCC 62051]|nr:hypothetical protein K438DRAFT_1852485 [Mycena galopus ATCC 62051]